MSSPFIERSKHPEMTALVTKHFGGGNQNEKSGGDAALSMTAGGSADWNSTPQPFPQEGGVNYTPPSQAGHSLKGDPFSTADGVPPDQRFWK